MATPNTSSSLPKSPNEQLLKCKELKDEGTSLFKIGEWRKSAKKYHHSLMYAKAVLSSLETSSGLSTLFGVSNEDVQTSKIVVTPEQQDEAKLLSISLSNNLAICMLKLEQWENVIKHTSNVLDHEPDNVKALYRRGTAFMKLGNLDASQNDLQKALELDPTDQGVRKQYLALQDMVKSHWKGEKLKYKRMFPLT